MKHLRKQNLVVWCSLILLLAWLSPEAEAQTPGDLIWHTYLGGDSFINNTHDRCSDMTMDEEGFIYIIGTSVNAWDTENVPVIPHTPNADNIHWELNRDVFVAKLDQDGSLIWHTFLGTPIHWWGQYYKQCTGSDEGFGIAVDGNGHVYVSGASDNPWGSPIVPYFEYYSYHKDAFLARLNAGTGVLEWNTFMGAANTDLARGVDVDAAGNVVVTGQSWGTWGSPLNVHHGGYGGDALVAKFDPSGNRLWNTFLGGANGDAGYDLEVDANGDIFITGQSALTFTTPPVWIIMDPVNPGTGGNDAFVAKLNSSGQLQWYTLHGGPNPGYDDYDIGNGISLDGGNGVYITGHSRTPWGTPVSGGGGWADVFAAKLNKSDGVLQWNTFFGSDMSDEGNAIDIAENGHIFITGQSYSYWGSWDAIVSELDNSGNVLWGTLLFSEQSPSGGGGGADKGYAVIAGNDGTVFMAGYSQNQWGYPVNPHSGPGADDALFARLYTSTNVAPDIACNATSVTVHEGETAVLTGTVSDPDGDMVTVAASIGSLIADVDGAWSWSFQTSDGSAESQFVTISADDGNGGTAETVFELTVENVPPVITSIVLPLEPVAIGDQPVSVTAGFSDAAGLNDAPFFCSVDYGDGTGPEPATVTGYTLTGPGHTYTLPGVYTITVSVTDKDGGIVTRAACEFIVIYDAAEGFVTGGGWIDSPAGAYIEDATLAGKASFGFVSKYKKGKTTPEGNTEFQFNAAKFVFKSTSYDWLIIAGSKAMYKGSGTINGEGDYGFQLSAIDADLTPSTDADLFRIRIWNKALDNKLVYDNKVGETDVNADPATAIGGGNIKIHKTGLSKDIAGADLPEESTDLPGKFSLSQNFPNPFNPSTTITYCLPEGEHHVRLTVYNVLGKEISTLVDQDQTSGVYSVDFNADGLASGVYFYKLSLPGFTETCKMYLGK